MRGRRTNDAQKALTGQSRKIRPSREMTPEVTVPDPPEYLTDGACEIWRRLAPDLTARGLLTVLDLEAFGTLCEVRDEELRLTAQILSEGETLPDKKGSRKAHPAVRLRNQARTTFLRLCARFGMDPDGRQKLGVKDPIQASAEETTLREILGSSNPFAQYIKRRTS